MIRTAWPHDLPVLRALFASANNAPYDLEAVAEEKCFGPGVRGPAVVRVFERNGQIAGAAVTSGRWLRLLIVARGERRRGIGTALLRDAEELGARVAAAEPGNYFTPGVLTTDQETTAFFHRQGYLETRWTWNLDVSLDERLPAVETGGPPTVRRPGHQEADRLLEFVEREFGRIWRFEAAKAFARDVPVAFLEETDGAISGFAVHDVNNRGLGFFGPTGVSPSMRGRGIGKRLLLASLRDMKRLGFARAVIPWTDSLDFYRRSAGAEPAHRFIAFARPAP